MNQQARRDEQYRKLMQEWIPVFVHLEREELRKFAHITCDADITPDVEAQFAEWEAYVGPLCLQCAREFGAISPARRFGNDALLTVKQRAHELLQINPDALAA